MIKKVYLSQVILLILFCVFGEHVLAQSPANIGFQSGNLSFWTHNNGSYTGATIYEGNYSSGTTNNPIPANLSTLTSGTAFDILTADNTNSARDPIITTLQKVPVINGYRYTNAVKLGNSISGAQADKMTYRLTVPTGVSSYNITYAFAMILQDPGHPAEAQPAFVANVLDLSQPAGQQKITCASKAYNASTPGLSYDTQSGIKHSDWQEVSIDLSQYAGKQIEINFQALDCAYYGHYGYAYFALRSENFSGLLSGSSVICNNSGNLTYTTPAIDGATFNWITPTGWTGTSTTNSITVNPNGNSGTISVTPSQSCGTIFSSSLAVTVAGGVPANPGPIAGVNTVCANGSVGASNLSYSIDAVLNATEYEWTLPTGWTIVDGYGTRSIKVNVASNASSGNISVRAKNACGYSINSSSQAFSVVSSQPSVGGSISPSSVALSCPQSNTLTLSGGTGTITKWESSNDGGFSWSEVSSSAGLSTLSVSPSSSAFYRAVVTNGSCPSAVSANSLINVKPLPKIVTQPFDRSICSGTATTFSVVATGDEAYQWYVSTDGGSNFTAISNGGVYSGATSATLTLSSGINNSYNNYKYRVNVTNTCDNIGVTSNIVGLTIYTSAYVNITSQPASVTVSQGSSTTLRVVADGPGLSYQWKSSSDNVNFTNISGATSSTYRPSTSSTGYFYFKVDLSSSSCSGSASQTSNTATLLVQVFSPAPSELSYTTPNVYTKGIAITSLSPTCTGTVTSFTVSPTLPAGLSINATTGIISGTPTTVTASNTYVVTASNSGGNTTFSVNILVQIPAPSALSYTTPNVFPKDIAITSLSPTYIGVVTGFSVSPTLPAGLSINATTGVISGIPTTITASNTYVVSASNGTGSITANVLIEIVAGDTDGDGVTDTQERTDGTDPIDACSYLVGSQTIANTSAAWKAADCDGDGTPNGTDSGPIDYCVGGTGFTIPKLGTAAYNNFFKNGDCDVDGISNHAECNGADNPDDFDGDGIPNYLDTDSDNDMMSDRDERRIDSDGDGDADYLDLDSDNDGILDKLEGNSDADGDGIKNYLDLDSDGDGIKDAWEAAGISEYHQDYNFDGRVSNADGSFPDANGNGLADFLESSMGGKPRGPQDTDKDGIPDYLDLDSDGDSLLDTLEQTYDVDGDGRPNYRDLDSDGDWIADFIDGTMDTDADGTKNFMDLDSDGDGIPDRYEGSAACDNCSGFVDNNNNGWDDRKEMVNPAATDTDGDGTPDFKDTDSDNDGIPDSVEVGKDPSKPVDTDGDGTPDFRDTDSDNDGIPDSVEAGKDPNKPVDTDGDGKPDYLDTDSDNDGIPDSVEAGKDPSKPVDTDGDGKPDYQDTDSDNDGIPDSVEAGKDPSKPVDTDGDGKPDYLDTDSDNDGIPDSVEAGKDPNKPVDTDGDGKPDYQDTDSDNDSIPDAVEAGKDPNKPVDTDGDGKPDYQDTDSDNDGIPDSIEAGKDPNKPVDTDGDGKPDYQDTDSDNDGIPDAVEAGKDPSKPVDTDGDGKPDYLDTDSDNDGIPDSVEAGKDPQVPVDTDKDGIPDYRDLDSDGDGIPDKIEAGKDPSKPVDTDGDGKPDYQDTDSDNDGIPDAVEAGNVNNPVDTDGDGKPDYQDTDSDNDGIPDKIEAGVDPTKPVDTDADGTPDYRDLDSDNDGYLDKEEAGKDPSNPVDTDKDGKPDYQDTDSDNDGILDKLENDINYGALADCDKDGVDNRIDADQCPTFSPNGISPNGDGKNDVLIIPGILRNQPNELTIFNRWGNVVYQTSNYKNDWGGQTDRAFSLLSSDNLLPDGTYYYVIDFFGKYPNVGTYVYINRQEK